MLRILHFSDIHLPPGPTTFAWSDFAHHRRIIGYLNYLVRRKWEFGEARATLRALEEWGRKQGFEHALFTGDLSQIGAPGELLAGRSALEAFRQWPNGLTFIPGNHDRYIPEQADDLNSAQSINPNTARDNDQNTTQNPDHNAFARIFSDWDGNGPWPRVTLLPENLALITLNSVIPHRWCWNAFGELGQSQCETLARLLTSPELRNRFFLIALHHAPFRPDGRQDDYFHGLHGTGELLETLKPFAERCILVHGHIHRRFHLRSAETRNIMIFGSGSATYAGREAFWVYEFDRGHGRALPGAWKAGVPSLEEPAITLF